MTAEDSTPKTTSEEDDSVTGSDLSILPAGVDYDGLVTIIASTISAKNWSIDRLRLSKLGNGFLTTVIRANIIWRRNDGEEGAVPDEDLPTSVAIKIADSGPSLELLSSTPSEDPAGSNEASLKEWELYLRTEWTPLMFENEISCYTFLKNVPQVPIPKLYGCSPVSIITKPPYIIMSDLSSAGKALEPGILPWEIAFELIDPLAHLHAYCIRNPSFVNHFSDRLKKTFKSYWDHACWKCNQVGKLIANPLCQGIEQYVYLVESERFCDLLMNSHVRMGLPPVLIHCDIWPENVIASEDRKRLIAMIDWQFAHVGNIADEFARIFVSTMSSELDKTKVEQFLDLYFVRLSSLIESVPFTRATLEAAIHEMTPSILLESMMFGTIGEGDTKIMTGRYDLLKFYMEQADAD